MITTKLDPFTISESTMNAIDAILDDPNYTFSLPRPFMEPVPALVVTLKAHS